MGKLKAGRLRPQNTVKLSIPKIFDYSITPGNSNGLNVWNVNVSPQLDQPVVVNSGIGFFNRYDVLFDPVNGKQGFRDRT
jgi:hypothetical protein